VKMLAAVATLCASACAGVLDSAPLTRAILDNRYGAGLTVHRGYWQAVSFADPVAPGASSDLQDTVPASPNKAYVLLTTGPSSALVVLQSRIDFGVALDQIVHIPVDDSTFAGNCAAGSPLTQAEADFITKLVFPQDFADLHYDAATCTTSSIGDAGAR